VLSAHGLVKRYGSRPALDGFDLRVQAGEIVGLIGHNGAGKSTFVSIVAGLTRPDRGRVTVDGIDVATDRRAVRRRLGLAPQEIALYPTATVRQNLRLFGGLGGLPRRTLAEAVDEVATALDLVDQLDRPVGVLSGGQRRRTQAATALVHRPPVLLLDEPTAGADPSTRERLLAVVRDRAAAGAAVCYTTHYLPELVELGATLAVARQGRIVARGDQGTLLAGLPGEVRVEFADTDPVAVSTTDPAAALAAILARGGTPTTVDIRRPDLDDLYAALEARP